MRMWMVDPKVMCRKHLLGEHLECHMFLGALKKGKSIKGYIKNNLFEPRSLYNRHKELVEEMKRRGYNHKSKLLKKDFINIKLSNDKVNSSKSLFDLLDRCKECRSRYLNNKGEEK